MLSTLMCSGLMAQIKFDEISLAEACAKAKSEKKSVLVVVSTTWCGPCKNLAKNVYPLKEVGDYINKDFISLRLEVDKHDPDDIKGRFGVGGYPTFLVLDGDGKEINRKTGMACDAEVFMTEVEKLKNHDVEVGIEYYREQYKKDPTKVLDLYWNLANLNLKDELNATIANEIKTQSVRQNVTQARMYFYSIKIKNLKCPIFDFLLANSEEIDAIYGKNATRNFVFEIINPCFFAAATPEQNPETRAQSLGVADEYPQFKSPYYYFIKDNLDIIDKRDIKATIKEAKKFMPKADPDSRQRISMLVHFMGNHYNAQAPLSDKMKKVIVDFYNYSIEYDTKMADKEGFTYSEKTIKSYNQRIETVTKSYK